MIFSALRFLYFRVMKSRIAFLFTLCCFVFVFSARAQGPIWEWETNCGNTGADKSVDVAIASDGSVYNCGYFNDGGNFGNIFVPGSATKDAYVAKQDAEGNFIWVRSLDSGADDRALGLCVDKDDNIIATGTYWITTTIDTFQLQGSSDHCFVVKYDPQGNVIWAITGGGEGDDHGYDVVTDANGTIYITGFLTNHWAPPVCTATFGSLPQFTYSDSIAFVASISSAGVWQWVRTFDGCDAQRDNDIAVDNQGGVYVTGGFYGQYKEFGPVVLSSENNSRDIFVIKYDTSGNFQWVKQVGGERDDRANGITVGADSMIYITGEFRDEVEFGDDDLNNNGGPGGKDIFVAKIDPDGNWKWATKAGSDDGSEGGRAITATADHCIFVTGQANGYHVWFGDSIFFDASTSGIQIFTAAIDTAGKWRWAQQAGGAGEDRGYGIEADEECRLYICGFYSAPVSDFGFFTDSAYGGKDGFTARLDVTCFDYVSDTVSGIKPLVAQQCAPYVDQLLVPDAGLANESVRIHNADCMQQGEWIIYNLWAQEVFVTTDLHAAWSATDANGNQLPAGTYFYELHSTDGSGITATGRILVVW